MQRTMFLRVQLSAIDTLRFSHFDTRLPSSIKKCLGTTNRCEFSIQGKITESQLYMQQG